MKIQFMLGSEDTVNIVGDEPNKEINVIKRIEGQYEGNYYFYEILECDVNKLSNLILTSFDEYGVKFKASGLLKTKGTGDNYIYTVSTWEPLN